jgi:hypothetical protein
MSLDKFGRYLVGADDGVNIDGRQGPPGEGFKLTPDKHYDLLNKRLVNLGDPKNEKDAVNFKSFRRLMSLNCLMASGNRYDLQNKRLVNLTDPTDEGDAVNYKSLKRSCLTMSGGGDYNALGRRVCSVASPIDGEDALTLKYANENYVKNNIDILLFNGNAYNANGRVITNIKSPLSGTDAVPLSYMVQNSLLKDDKMDVYNALDKNIRHLKWPATETDAVNKQYVDTLCPLLGTNGWQFLFQPLKGVGNPIDPSDAVNYSTVLDLLHKLVIFILLPSVDPIVVPPELFKWNRDEVLRYFFNQVTRALS